RAEVSVRELAAFAFPGGSIQTASKIRRMERDGQKAHLEVQGSRGEEYQSEITLKYSYVTSDLSLLIRGRIDGLTVIDGETIIEEIKTSRFPLDDIEPNDRHLAQARIYAAIYAEQNSLDNIRVDLTYFSMASSREQIFAYEYSSEDLREFFTSLVDSYIDGLIIEIRRRASRDATLAAGEFPFPSIREGQMSFMEAVNGAIQNKEKLFVRAPTGIGKTAAALFPALKSIVNGHASLIFYLSARTTQQRNAENYLELTRAAGSQIRSITITARAKICFLNLEICEPDSCPFAQGYYDRLPDALREVSSRPGLGYTREKIEALARLYTLCPYELSLDVSLFSDVIICDYNYVFDPMVYLRRFFQYGDPKGYVLLVDEAHNLVDRSREMFSGIVRKRHVHAAKKVVDPEDHPELSDGLKRMNSYFISLRNTMKEESLRFWVADDIDTEFQENVAEILEHLTNYFSGLRGDPIPDEITVLYRLLLQYSVVSDLQSAGHRFFAELGGSDVLVKLLCIDPSDFLRRITDRCRAAVFFSATLTPFEYFTGLIDGGERVVTLSLDSPFPRENLGVFIDSKISTRYRDRDLTVKPIVEYVKSFYGRGNCIFFFPSYAYLEMVNNELAEKSPEYEILVQERGMDDFGRREFLEAFSAEHPDGVIAFAVLGGIFGEGIDLVGQRLVAAVIIGVGLPAITDEGNLMKLYYKEKFGNGFSFAYIYPGMNRVLQAAGRVIRSEIDTGTVLFIGQRFGTETYQKLLTPEYKSAKTIRSASELESYRDS
ncbi:MAG: ATP-dependent DNA helicase, partial [Spirochaetales bacterium]|nr:ATP-dependent DNA helicase [Spirochaetales bacterium]